MTECDREKKRDSAAQSLFILNTVDGAVSSHAGGPQRKGMRVYVEGGAVGVRVQSVQVTWKMPFIHQWR